MVAILVLLIFKFLVNATTFQLSTDNKMAAKRRKIIIYFKIFNGALKPGIYRFSGCASLLTLSVVMCNPKRSYSSYLDFIIGLLLYAYRIAAVVSDLWPFWVTASAEGCLSACTIFLSLISILTSQFVINVQTNVF